MGIFADEDEARPPFEDALVEVVPGVDEPVFALEDMPRGRPKPDNRRIDDETREIEGKKAISS